MDLALGKPMTPANQWAWLRRIFWAEPAHRFASVSMLLLISLAIAPTKDFFNQWRHYQRQYIKLIQGRSDGAALLRRYESGIHQIWIPELGVVDRCTTCHQGIAESSLENVSVPQPFRSHPPVPHHLKAWGCVVCHRGQGAATEVAEAHETTAAWEQPILPANFIQGACGTCHQNDLPETPLLNRGRQLLTQLNCSGCHRLPGIDTPAMLGPDLTNVGAKVSREWLYKWLKEPRTITDAEGSVTVDGVDTNESLRMPQYRLTEQELRALSGYLSVQQRNPVEAYKFDPRVVAGLSKRPDLADQGEVRFRQMFCSTCHSLAVTRAGETKLVGGDIAPELTKVGSKVNRAWLVAWLRNPQSYLPHAEMPRYQWSDEDLYEVTQFMETNLTDPDLLAKVPQLGVPTDAEVQFGRRLFLDKGCGGCHIIAGTSPQEDYGPDLSALGGRGISKIDFGTSKIQRNLISYVEAKIANPSSVNSIARMPQYYLTPADLDAVTTALLSMVGTPATRGMEKLVVLRQEAEFHPTGEPGKIYERYKCYVCHKFNGYGGTLAPDLSYEGSRVNRQWLIDFMKNPQTLRPTLVLRMPQFNISDADAIIIADYIEMSLQHPKVNPVAVNRKEFTPEMATLGKQLYEHKYRCEACHTIGSTGGYVGPNLSNVGNWITPAWMEAWLRNPQALVPGTIEPTQTFTQDEIKELAAYLLTLKEKAARGKPLQVAAAGGPR
jgi:mono/diheme cytochrome c family protein